MRLSMILRFAALAGIFGLTALSLPAQDQSAGDVAAAARKTREQQQKSGTKPKKVLTNDDIPSAKTDTSATDANAVPKEGASQDAAQADKDAENDPKSEAYWRKRFQSTRSKLSSAEQELDVLQRELDKGQVQYYSDPQKALMQEHDRSDINDKTAKIDAKKKEIDGLKQQLSDMEDELRKAGGDPGWAR